MPDEPPPRLVLASSSPRRQQLLEEAGFEFVVHPPQIDEEKWPADMKPSDVAGYLAAAKADAVAIQFPRDVILAADTIVVFDEQVLGKPSDADDARQMLQLLSGTTQIVITAVTVLHRVANFARSGRVMSAVAMRNMARQEIDRHIASGDWRGKAGGYGLQDEDPFVTRIAGSRSNVVGLPMSLTRRLLAEAGIRPTKPAP